MDPDNLNELHFVETNFSQPTKENMPKIMALKISPDCSRIAIAGAHLPIIEILKQESKKIKSL